MFTEKEVTYKERGKAKNNLEVLMEWRYQCKFMNLKNINRDRVVVRVHTHTNTHTFTCIYVPPLHTRRPANDDSPEAVSKDIFRF